MIVKIVRKTLYGVLPKLGGFVCAFHPAAPGSSPKQTIYTFINLLNSVRRKNKKRPGLGRLKKEKHFWIKYNVLINYYKEIILLLLLYLILFMPIHLSLFLQSPLGDRSWRLRQIQTICFALSWHWPSLWDLSHLRFPTFEMLSDPRNPTVWPDFEMKIANIFRKLPKK